MDNESLVVIIVSIVLAVFWLYAIINATSPDDSQPSTMDDIPTQISKMPVLRYQYFRDSEGHWCRRSVVGRNGVFFKIEQRINPSTPTEGNDQ